MDFPQSPVTSQVPWPKKLVAALVMLLVYYGIQGLTLLLNFTHRMLPPEQVREHPWIGVYEHHFWQMAFALLFIGVYSRGRFADWGLNLRNARLSWHILARFCLWYSLAVGVINLLPRLLGVPLPPLGYPLTAVNVVGWLSFQWLFVGVSEEILFRGLIHTYLARTWRGAWRAGGVVIPTAGVITTVIFCLAHVDIFPPHVNWVQQAAAVILGLYYSTVYHRTGSLLNPILAHNFSDGLVFSILFILHAWGR